MAVTFQLYNDGACIRIEQHLPNNVLKVLMLAKDQVRTIDIIKGNIVRIDIGEGPLKNIFLNQQDVTLPATADAEELRAAINGMMNSEVHDLTLAKETTQQSVLEQIQTVAGILQTIKDKETDFSQIEPSRVDESNPNMVFRGWHKGFGVPDVNEWAIERVTRVNDEEIHEWAFGHKKQIYKWTDRTTLQFAPWDHDLPIQAPLP
jgi:hypothetical protein